MQKYNKVNSPVNCLHPHSFTESFTLSCDADLNKTKSLQQQTTTEGDENVDLQLIDSLGKVKVN